MSKIITDLSTLDINEKKVVLEGLINEYKLEADDWFKKEKITDLVETRYNFFKTFFDGDLNKYMWKDFQKIGDNLHSLFSNSLAKTRAFGKANLELNEYRERFNMIKGANNLDEISTKYDLLINDKQYKIRYFAQSSVAETLGYVYPELTFICNSRTMSILKIFGVNNYKYNSKTTYLNLIEFLNKIKEIYVENIENRYTKTSINLEFDQFLSWYSEKQKNINPSKSNYWIFQANPDIYNLYDALKKGNVKSWRVVNFKKQIKIGDLVIIWQTGKNSGCYALAKVVSEVQIMDDLNLDLEHYTNKVDPKKEIERVKLEILNNFADNPIKNEEIKDLIEFAKFKAGIQGTNFSATKEEYERIKLLRDLDKDSSSNKSDEEISKTTNNKTQPLNQILYGPPGTGKTYKTINKALKIIDPVVYALNKKNRNVLKKEFKRYVDEGRIVFTSFHQSLSYEDFIEGIKPDTNQDGSIKYEVKDGIFKKIINNINLKKINNNNVFNNLIKDDTNYLKVSLGNSLNDNDSLIYDYCINKNCIAIGWGEDINFTTTKSEEEVKEKILKSGIETKERDYNLIAIKCLKFWTKVGDIVFVSNGNKKIRAIGKIDGDYFYDENTEIRFKQFRPVQWLIKDADIDVNLVYNKNFSQQTIYMLFNNEIKKSFFNSFDTKENEKNVTDNFVLIIDEINRGNVSQIFGELITLIEEDKRLGKDEELTVKLPYSQDDFGVPPNLYIIGTMNTADRSVEALDTALRRRFSFVEMMPEPELIKEEWKGEGEDPIIEGIKLIDLMKTINKRIEMLLDRDHLIGHSYFMYIKDAAGLANTFKDKIIPLLQEYFYGDYGKIGLVLGKGFVSVAENKNTKAKSIFADFSYENNEDLIKPIFTLVEIKEKNIIDFLGILIGIKKYNNKGVIVDFNEKDKEETPINNEDS